MKSEDSNGNDGMFSSSSYQEYVIRCAAENTEPAEEPVWKIAKAFRDRLLNRTDGPIPEYCVPDPSCTSLATGDLTAGFARTEWNFKAGSALTVNMPYQCRPGILYTDNLAPVDNTGPAAGFRK